MAYGFVTAYGISLAFATALGPSTYPLVASSTGLVVLAGLIGGFFPDIDQLEFWGWPKSIRKYFTHKKTFHFIAGYLALSIACLVLAATYPQSVLLFLLLACWSFGAWVHSLMDPLDGWRDDNPKEGIYEHVTRRWLPSLRLVMFAGMWEWVIQAFAAIWFIPISANLSPLIFPGWKFGTVAYFLIWLISAVFDAFHRAPKRQPRERDLVRTFRGLQ